MIVVGADKGGVGKTTVSRTLLDYFTAHHVPTRAFDTESPKGTLKRFHPDISDIVDATSVPDQMRIFDTLSTTDASVKLAEKGVGEKVQAFKADPNAGQAEFNAAAEKASLKASGDFTKLSSANADAIAENMHAAANAGVAGAELMRQKWIQAEEDIIRKGKEHGTAQAVVNSEMAKNNAEYFADLDKRNRESVYQAEKSRSDAQAIGMTGAPLAEHEYQDKLKKIQLDEDNGNVFTQNYTANDARQDAAIERDNKVTEEKKQFYENLTSIAERANSSMLSGVARVAAEERKLLGDLAKTRAKPASQSRIRVIRRRRRRYIRTPAASAQR